MEPYSLHRPQYFSTFSMVVTYKCSDEDSSGNMALISLFISSETEGFLKLYRWPFCGAISMKRSASALRPPLLGVSMMKSGSTQETVLLYDKEGTSGVDPDFTDKLLRYRWLWCQYLSFINLILSGAPSGKQGGASRRKKGDGQFLVHSTAAYSKIRSKQMWSS